MPDPLSYSHIVIGAPTLGYQLLTVSGEVLSQLTMEGARDLLKNDGDLRKRSYQVSFPQDPKGWALADMLFGRFSPRELKSFLNEHMSKEFPGVSTMIPDDQSAPGYFKQMAQLLINQGLPECAQAFFERLLFVRGNCWYDIQPVARGWGVVLKDPNPEATQSNRIRARSLLGMMDEGVL
tara:strand:+ start:706 stop:1245 length:540 start_codon:yes stop_codon:yes gene_type:complete